MPHEVLTYNVHYPYNGTEGTAYLARPSGPGRFPVLIVLHEFWGLNRNIRDITRRFAAEGYVAAAPDLYHGRVTTEVSEARKMMAALDFSRAIRNIEATAARVVEEPDAMPDGYGCVGYCLGGSLAILLACRSQRLRAACPYYGQNPLDLEELANATAPILALYAQDDTWSTVQMAEDLERATERHGVPFESVIHPNAPHGFFNDTLPSYRPAIAQDAWRRTLEFFDAHLRHA